MAKGCLNRVTLVGNLGSDPEMRFTPRRTAVVTCSLATTESWVDRAGQVCERAEWHKLVMWRHIAETAKQQLRKGSRVYVEGKLNTRVWDDARGRKNCVIEIVVKNLKLLGANQVYLDEPIDETPLPTQVTAPDTPLELSFEPSL